MISQIEEGLHRIVYCYAVDYFLLYTLSAIFSNVTYAGTYLTLNADGGT